MYQAPGTKAKVAGSVPSRLAPSQLLPASTVHVAFREFAKESARTHF